MAREYLLFCPYFSATEADIVSNDLFLTSVLAEVGGIKNTGLGDIAWVLGLVSCSITRPYGNLLVHLEQKAGWVTCTWKRCAGILPCIPMLYVWALTGTEDLP